MKRMHKYRIVFRDGQSVSTIFTDLDLMATVEQACRQKGQSAHDVVFCCEADTYEA